MPFPFVLNDFSGLSEIARINPDGSITVLAWDRVYNWSVENPKQTDGFIVSICQILRAARYNFVETPLAESNRMGENFRLSQNINYPGNIGFRLFNQSLDPIVELDVEDHIWEVNWSKVLDAHLKHPSATDDTAVFVGFLRLFLAAQDNLVMRRMT